MPAVVAHYDTIPHSKGVGWRRLSKTILFDVTYGLACRVPLTKLAKWDGEISSYLIVLMVATLAWAGKTLAVLEGTHITIMTGEDFENMLLKEASCNCNNYGLASR